MTNIITSVSVGEYVNIFTKYMYENLSLRQAASNLLSVL